MKHFIWRRSEYQVQYFSQGRSQAPFLTPVPSPGRSHLIQALLQLRVVLHGLVRARAPVHAAAGLALLVLRAFLRLVRPEKGATARGGGVLSSVLALATPLRFSSFQVLEWLGMRRVAYRS